MSVSFHHVMFSCTSCSDHFQPLTGKLRSVGLPLCTKSLAVCDQREGWSLLRAATRLVYTCERERILCLMSSDVMRHIRDKLYETLNTATRKTGWL